MTATGGARRWWRWAVAVWAALVLVGGALTLWLQDRDEPDPPARWERAPAPRLSPEAHGTACPTQGAFEQPVSVACLESTAAR
ncbi:hypothetical protein [Streptomyces sp. NPDC002573]|uniref:hypothetical protein n=1 Tax=Streptomyces sp. NPDC002573 TaxID=3364651 RepID=UPI0036D0379B